MIKYTEDEKYIPGRLMVVQEGIGVHAGHEAGQEVPGLPSITQCLLKHQQWTLFK